MSDETLNKEHFSRLPAETIVHILSFLDYRALVNCSITCQRLHQISQDDDLWRLLCTHFLVDKPDEQESWKDTFQEFYKEYGKYLSCYRSIKTAWNQIEQYFLRKGGLENPFLKSMNGPASESVIDSAERRMGYPLPLDLRCSFRIHNGQRHFTPAAGFINNSSVRPPRVDSEYILDVMTMVEKYEYSGEARACAPLTYRGFSRFNGWQLIALTEEGGHNLGEVFIRVLRLEGHKLEDQFITANSYTQWLTQLAKDISSDHYLWEDNQLTEFYRYPSCVAITRDFFKAEVATCFLPDVSSVIPAQFTFRYHITISMDKSAPDNYSCQLETRHWIITDEDGIEERVDGPGVVGEFPVLKPGSSHSWVSYTGFTTTYGNMKGHFTMRNLRSGEKFDIECPCYHMKCLPYKLSEERGIKRRERKKTL